MLLSAAGSAQAQAWAVAFTLLATFWRTRCRRRITRVMADSSEFTAFGTGNVACSCTFMVQV